MFDFSLTEEQHAFKDMIRKFAKKEVEPISAEADKIQDPKATWPVIESMVRKGLQLGLGKVAVPAAYGGIGGGLCDLMIMGEELAAADSGIAAILLVSASLARVIALAGTEQQKEKWLRPIGEDESGKYILAGAMTEPSGGNEIMCPLPDPALGVRTTATRDGKGYRIKGQKCFITNAGIAEIYMVLARTRKDKPNIEGCNVFLFHKDTKGYQIGKIEDKMGNRLQRNGEIFFDDMWVPEEDMIGQEGLGVLMLDEIFRGNSVAFAGATLGIARAAYNSALNYARERVIWGRPLIQNEVVASKLMQMRMKIEACRALVEKLIWAIENPLKGYGLDKLARIAKVNSSEMVIQVTSEAMYLMGGYGYMKEYPVEKYLRDGLIGRVVEGSNETNELFMSFDLQPI